MRILHFCTYDIIGGAAKATYRLHTALRDAGHQSTMVVQNKQSDDEDVQQALPIPSWQYVLKRTKNFLPVFGRKLPSASYTFNLDTDSYLNPRFFFRSRPEEVDLISLHWITDLLTVRMIKKIYGHYRRPVLWTLMDMEPITGGCHYTFGCDGFKKRCGHCPQLTPSGANDHSRVLWRKKYESLRHLPITFVAPTSWIAERVRESSLFGDCRVEVIPLAIDSAIFRPFNPRAARELLNLPQDKKVIFLGSTYMKDPRKGMVYLKDALHHLCAGLMSNPNPLRREEIYLLIAGRHCGDLSSVLPFPSRVVGYLQDDLTLALAYQAADLFVCPSVEDAGPMMIPESMLCGTPVVAFNTGGAPDLIETKKTGYLAAYKDSSDLARGIYELLCQNNIRAVRSAAHEVAVRKHSPSVVAARYVELYQMLQKESYGYR